MSRRTKTIIVIVAIVLVLGFAIITRAIDTKRAENGEMPIFCVKMAEVGDGGSEIYIGLGYKVIKYDTADFKYIAIGGWTLEYGDVPENWEEEEQ